MGGKGCYDGLDFQVPDRAPKQVKTPGEEENAKSAEEKKTSAKNRVRASVEGFSVLCRYQMFGYPYR